MDESTRGRLGYRSLIAALVLGATASAGPAAAAPATKTAPTTRTAPVARIVGFPYRDLGLDERLGRRSRPLAKDGDASDAPGALDRRDRGWIGLVERGRVLIQQVQGKRFIGKPRWVADTKRRWAARAALSRQDLPRALQGWVGARLVGIDARGKPCPGTVVRVESEARVYRSRPRLPKEPAADYPRTPWEVYTKGHTYLFGIVRWQRASCARTALVARRHGASLPRVINRVKLSADRAKLLRARFAWSPAWALVQRRYAKMVRESNPEAYRWAPRRWDKGSVEVAGYTGGARTVYLAQADVQRACSAIDGHLVLRIEPKGPVASGDTTVIDRWSHVNKLPQVLLHFPRHRVWLGLIPGHTLFRFGGVAITPGGVDVLATECNC